MITCCLGQTFSGFTMSNARTQSVHKVPSGVRSAMEYTSPRVVNLLQVPGWDSFWNPFST